MHPRSKHWHMLDYVITRQWDVHDIHLTRVMRGTDCWSGRRLVRCTVTLRLSRLAKASAAIGRLLKHLWNDHGIQLTTKSAVYKAVVLTTLLYGCESWTLYHRHTAKLDQF